jgi:Icc-related predicted phosphoesterase
MMSTHIQVVSDLHIEYKNDEIPDPLKYITPVANILVLAGDIGSFYKINQLKGFLERLCPLFDVVLYVPGNHEYYTVHDCEKLSMTKLIRMLYDIENDIKNLFILNQSSVTIGDICITGCTLWSKALVTLPKFIVRIHGINDEIYDKKHQTDVRYINKMIDYCKDNNLKLVVVTHYCPTYQIVSERRKKDRYISLYTSELDHLLYKDKIDTWICGHIHENFNTVTQGGTKIVGNQLGKPRDKIMDYRKDLIVEV